MKTKRLGVKCSSKSPWISLCGAERHPVNRKPSPAKDYTKSNLVFTWATVCFSYRIAQTDLTSPIRMVIRYTQQSESLDISFNSKFSQHNEH